MKLKDVLAISGQGGLFKFVAQSRNGIIVESLADGTRTCAPAMEIISDTARSNIPALGYAGTYAIANVLLTLAGTLIVIIWPGLQ